MAYTKEQKKAYAEKQSAELAQQGEHALETLREQIAQGGTAGLQDYLRFMAGFRQYSWHNCMLIWLQCPDATLCAGAAHWRKKGRLIIKGQKGLRIWAPMTRTVEDKKTGEKRTFVPFFKSVPVFDVSQTHGDDLPEAPADIPVQGDPAALIAHLERLCSHAGIGLHDVPRISSHPQAKGQASRRASGLRIDLRDDLAPADRAHVLAHELAHCLMHFGEDRAELSTQAKELEAESIAYAVCTAYGLDVGFGSANYVVGWSGDAEKLSESLDRIRIGMIRILWGE